MGSNPREEIMNTDEKHTLLLQLKDSSYQAFTRLYEEYFDMLYGFVFSLVRSHDVTTEIVQETFIKVWVNRTKIDLEQSFKAWLYRMARNLLLDHIKKQFRNPLFEDYLAHTGNEKLAVSADETRMDFDTFRHTLIKVKNKLPPRQAEIFELCKEQGIPAPEVARRLNITEQAVYNNLSLAMKLIRKEMAPYASFLTLFF